MLEDLPINVTLLPLVSPKTNCDIAETTVIQIILDTTISCIASQNCKEKRLVN
jgi:hypothetical protein